MVLYKPSPTFDILLTGWWHRMRELEELEQTFSRDTQSLSGFLRLFQSPNVLAVEHNGLAVQMAVWLEPMLSGAFMGLWIEPRLRGTKRALQLFEMAVEGALEEWPVLLALTKQPGVHAMLERMGYNTMSIPNIFDGEDAWVGWLTKEAWDGRRQRRREKFRAAH